MSPLKLIINRDYKSKTYYFVRFSIKSAHFFNHLIDERWETGNSDRDELIDYLRWNRDASCACNMVSYFIVFEYSNSVSSMLFVPYRWNGGGGGAIVYLAVGYSLYRGLSATCILSPISCYCVPNWVKPPRWCLSDKLHVFLLLLMNMYFWN